jgi:NADPH:quinone reductase-like Zn-dependent oxidoreductase
MRAIRYHQYGGPEQLVLEQIPRPEVQPGAVLVHVRASAVNPVDWKLRTGAFHQFMPVQFPKTPGLDLAGVVEEIGPGVTGFERGQAVYGLGDGTNAEYAIAAASSLAPMPRGLTFDQAASVPLGALTAWRALFDAADLQPGQRILIQGAAGGVGMNAVQLARWKGAHVAGTASARNLDFIRSLGVEEAIDYLAAPFETVVRDMDVVLDTVGGDALDRSLQVLRRGGILVTVAGQPPQEEAAKRGIRAAGVGMADPARTGELLRRFTELIEAGRLRVQVDSVFLLAEAGRAHAQSQQGHGRGRIVLHVAGADA